MSKALIKLQFAVPAGFAEGDYACLYGDSGTATMDWDTPLSQRKFPLFPGGNGIKGFGHAPFGHSPFGHAYSSGPYGFGHLPFGKFPWGYGTAIVRAAHEVSRAGIYQFAFVCFDSLGNPDEGSPEVITIPVALTPSAPAGLKKKSYNPATKILILDAA